MRRPVADPGKETDTPAPTGAASALLHDLCAWREQLARSVARNNIGMRSGEIGTAVHRIVFSLVLLAIAEDRGLVPPGQIREILVAEESDCPACGTVRGRPAIPGKVLRKTRPAPPGANRPRHNVP